MAVEDLTPELRRAALLSGLPGVTLDEACKRFAVKKSALQRARQIVGRAGLQPTPTDLLVAALSANGSRRQGTLPKNLATIASFIDHVNRDGCDSSEVETMLESLVADGTLALTKRRWKLVGPWPR